LSAFCNKSNCNGGCIGKASDEERSMQCYAYRFMIFLSWMFEFFVKADLFSTSYDLYTV